MGQSVSVSRAVSGTADAVWIPRGFQRDRYPVILCHGATWAGQFSGLVAATPSAMKLAYALERAGITCMAVGQADGWGNDALDTAAVSGAVTYLASIGVNTRKIGLLGISMGAGTSMSYMRENPTKVAAMASIEGLASLTDVWNKASLAAFRASIGAAWGVAYPAALPANAEQINYAATLATSGSMRLYYSTADQTITPSTVTALATAVKTAGGDAKAIINSTTVDHGDGPIAAMISRYKPSPYAGEFRELVDFFKSKGC